MYNANQSQSYIHPTMTYNGATRSYSHPYTAQQPQQQQQQHALYAQTPSNTTLFNGWNASYQAQSQQNYTHQHPHSHQTQAAQAVNNSASLTQYNVTKQHYSQLVQHPNFTNNRSPFYQVEKRCCVMPVFSQKRIQFRISLHGDDVNSILRGNMNGNEDKKGLHLRLFNFVTHEHQEWNTSQCDVSINNRKIIIDKRSTRSGVKKKGYHIVAPLDITKEACITMDFEITSNGPFAGVAVIEIVRIFSVESIASRIVARYTPIDPQKDKKCVICGRTSDL
eukprot:416333_1